MKISFKETLDNSQPFLSHVKIAEKMGVNKNTITNWYNGHYKVTKPKGEKLIALFKEYNRQIVYLKDKNL